MATRFPEWIRRNWGSGYNFDATRGILQDLGLHTVCQSAQCPNIGDCWHRRTATIMVLRNVCTRRCAFCAVSNGVPVPVDPDEPRRVAEAVHRLELAHAVITSVTRDDLPDGGATHFAATIRAIRALNADTTIEVLVPDFQGDASAISTICDARPDVFGHNIETVSRLYPVLRDPRYNYSQSLRVLAAAADAGKDVIIKSAFMLGHGETRNEVRSTLEDLLDAGCVAVAIGQYLQPTPKQREVAEFIHPDTFKTYEELARDLGFAYAVAGPFVRSSYRSGELVAHLSRPVSVHGAVASMPI